MRKNIIIGVIIIIVLVLLIIGSSFQYYLSITQKTSSTYKKDRGQYELIYNKTCNCIGMIKERRTCYGVRYNCEDTCSSASCLFF